MAETVSDDNGKREQKQRDINKNLLDASTTSIEIPNAQIQPAAFFRHV